MFYIVFTFRIYAYKIYMDVMNFPRTSACSNKYYLIVLPATVRSSNDFNVGRSCTNL